jgi:rubredoxin/uncharacterized membrane protein
MKKWQCLVCGYIHTGDEPPEKCPVCGADKSQFVEITEMKPEPAPKHTPRQTATSDPEKAAKTKTKTQTDPASPASAFLSVAWARQLMVKHHLHPITVHFPNGVIPVAVAFIFLAVIFQCAGLAEASFYNMIFVVLTLPVVLYSGYNEWQLKYRGAMTRIFKIKIFAALTVTATALIIVAWYLVAPGTLEASSSGRTIYLLLHLIMLGATGIAGHFGGKLVFKD